MKKILFIFLMIIIVSPINAFAISYPTLHYENAIIYDLTDNKILYELKSNEQKSIASLTKLMTIITAIENTSDLNKTVVYDQNMKKYVAWYASKAGFNVGETYTFNDLLYAAMLPSGADATIALAISTSGSIEEFVKKMNNTAEKIGMTSSNFVNVHGLDEENHYSTAEDIRKLLEYALKNETFKKVYTAKEYTLSTGKTIKSTVKKMSESTGIDITKIIGSKTGTTGNAGLCISVLMSHKEHEIIIITLGASQEDKVPHNIIDANQLIEFIENNYDNQTLIEKNKIIKEIKIKNSKSEVYKIKNSKDISLFLENDYDKNKFKIEYSGIENLSYKNDINEKIGVIKYYYEDKEINSEYVYLKENIEPDYLKIISSNKLMISVITSIIAIIILIITINIKYAVNKKKKIV